MKKILTILTLFASAYFVIAKLYKKEEVKSEKPLTLTLIGYIKIGNGGFGASDGCGATNLTTAVYSDTRTLGQLAVGDILKDAGGNPINGGGQGYGFVSVSGGNATRGIKLGGTNPGEIESISLCSGSVQWYYNSSAADCDLTSFPVGNAIYGNSEDQQLYVGKILHTNLLGGVLGSTTGTISNSVDGTAVYTFTTDWTGKITTVSCCSTNPTSNAGADASYEVSQTPKTLSGSGSDCDGTVSSYAWSQISGPNTATITSPSSATTTITGTAVGTYVFELEVTDNSSNTATDQVTMIVFPDTYGPAIRLPSGDSLTYDFTGASGKGSPGLWKYFTDDPDDDARITRNVADFNRDSLGGKGWRGMINLQAEYTLDGDTAITYHDRSGSVDTIDLYTFDKDNAPTWDLITHPEDYTPDYRIISCGTCSGIPIDVRLGSSGTEKVQFIFVNVKRTNIFSGLWPDLSAISFHGRATGDADTLYNLAHWAFNQWTSRSIKDIVGNFNLQNQQDTIWHDTSTGNGNYGYFRSFDQMFFDNQAVKDGYQFDLGGAGYTAYKYNEALSRRGNYQHVAVFNDNAYYKFQLDSIHHANEKGWGTNTIYDDPQDPLAYSRKGQYMGFQAARGGTNTTPRFYPTYNGTMEYGKGYLKSMGTSNEPTLFAFANAWKTNIEVAAEGIGVVDSIHAGDPNMLVFLAGTEAYNYPDAKAQIMLMKLWYRSRNIHINGYAYHGIHTLKTDLYSVIPTSAQQVGNHGVSSGYNDDWHKDIHYIQGLRREVGDPNFLVQQDEDGYQKGVYIRYPRTELETFSVSQLGTPRFTVDGVTLDAYKSQMVALMQRLMAVSATGMYKWYLYTLVDDILKTTNPDYDAIDGNNGAFDRPATCCTETPESHPLDYGLASFKHAYGDFHFVDTTLFEFRARHIFKFYHESNDTTGYMFNIMDSTGTDTYELTGLPNGTAWIVTPSMDSRTATREAVTISGGTYTLDIDPMPRMLLVLTPSVSPTINQTRKYGKRIINH